MTENINFTLATQLTSPSTPVPSANASRALLANDKGSINAATNSENQENERSIRLVSNEVKQKYLPSHREHSPLLWCEQTNRLHLVVDCAYLADWCVGNQLCRGAILLLKGCFKAQHTLDDSWEEFAGQQEYDHRLEQKDEAMPFLEVESERKKNKDKERSEKTTINELSWTQSSPHSTWGEEQLPSSWCTAVWQCLQVDHTSRPQPPDWFSFPSKTVQISPRERERALLTYTTI